MDSATPGTAAGLVEFLAWALDKGELKAATANSLRTAVNGVLAAEEDPDALDLRTADLDAVLRRFENKNRNKYNEQSMETYKRRFLRSVEMYLARLDGREWRPATRSSRGLSARDSKPNGDAATAPAEGLGTSAASAPAPIDTGIARGHSLVEYPFPIRPGLRARLQLPDDLSQAEAERVAGFVKALVVNIEQPVSSSHPPDAANESP